MRGEKSLEPEFKIRWSVPRRIQNKTAEMSFLEKEALSWKRLMKIWGRVQEVKVKIVTLLFQNGEMVVFKCEAFWFGPCSGISLLPSAVMHSGTGTSLHWQTAKVAARRTEAICPLILRPGLRICAAFLKLRTHKACIHARCPSCTHHRRALKPSLPNHRPQRQWAF